MTDWKKNGLPVIITDKNLTVTLPNLKSITIDSSDSRYEPVLEAIAEKRWEDVPELIDPARAIKRMSDGKFVLVGDKLKIDGKFLPESLSTRIVSCMRNGFPFDGLIKFWENLKKNPSANSVAETHRFLERNNLPITPDGCFIAFRKVRDDFTDNHTGTMDNSPGQVLSMDRNEVDDDPNRGCSFGLHVAAEDYAKGFSGTRLVVVKVNPKNVVAVPKDYHYEKMRVCEFEVINEITEDEMEDIQSSPIFDDGSGFDEPELLVTSEQSEQLNRGMTFDDEEDPSTDHDDEEGDDDDDQDEPDSDEPYYDEEQDDDDDDEFDSY